MKSRFAQGFTLLEMSIVLVIIGIIIGAIMYGKALITSAKLQTAITDTDSYISAVANFKQTYQSLPGDMASATTIWSAVFAGCTTQQGTGTQTCNGNGDGEIGSVSGQEYETFRFWQHLHNAGMLIPSVTGVPGPAAPGSPYDSVPGVNVPASALKGSGFSAIWYGTITASSTGYCTHSDCYTGSYGNVLQLGGLNSGSITNAGIITSDQASLIDAKIDDGYPATGKIRTYAPNSTINPNCTLVVASNANCSTNTTLPGCYNASSNTTILCSLIFVTGF